jgi:hypothetical protein
MFSSPVQPHPATSPGASAATASPPAKSTTDTTEESVPLPPEFLQLHGDLLPQVLQTATALYDLKKELSKQSEASAKTSMAAENTRPPANIGGKTPKLPLDTPKYLRNIPCTFSAKPDYLPQEVFDKLQFDLGKEVRTSQKRIVKAKAAYFTACTAALHPAITAVRSKLDAWLRDVLHGRHSSYVDAQITFAQQRLDEEVAALATSARIKAAADRQAATDRAATASAAADTAAKALASPKKLRSIVKSAIQRASPSPKPTRPAQAGWSRGGDTHRDSTSRRADSARSARRVTLDLTPRFAGKRERENDSRDGRRPQQARYARPGNDSRDGRRPQQANDDRPGHRHERGPM